MQLCAKLAVDCLLLPAENLQHRCPVLQCSWGYMAGLGTTFHVLDDVMHMCTCSALHMCTCMQIKSDQCLMIAYALCVKVCAAVQG